MPGVVNNSPMSPPGVGGFNTTNVLNVNGQGQGGSLYLLDGVWNVSSENHNQTNIMPNPDSIAEVKVLQNNYDAKYTIMGGGVIMVQTKSGTDDFHGVGSGSSFGNTELRLQLLQPHRSPLSMATFSGGKWADRSSSLASIPRTTTRPSFITISSLSNSSSNRS